MPFPSSPAACPIPYTKPWSGGRNPGGIAAVAETCTVQEICKTQVAQRFSEVAHTGERRDRVRNGGEEEDGTGRRPWQQPLV